jgi:hypothetical protein
MLLELEYHINQPTRCSFKSDNSVIIGTLMCHFVSYLMLCGLVGLGQILPLLAFMCPDPQLSNQGER